MVPEPIPKWVMYKLKPKRWLKGSQEEGRVYRENPSTPVFLLYSHTTTIFTAIHSISDTRLHSPHFVCQMQVQIITCASDCLALNKRFPHAHFLGLINVLEQLTELRKTVTAYFYEFNKGYNKGYRWKVDEKIHRERSGRVPKCRSFCPCEIKMHYSPSTWQ